MKLKFNDYYDKVLGCYTGKNIGGTLGAPFECFRGEYNISWFMQDISEPIPNDDVDLQLVWLRMAELEGRKIDSHTFAEYWNTYISATLSEYGTGKNNFNMGIMPPLSGVMRNPNRDSNGAWIRTEIWACLCAGNPALAANYAYYDSCVDHGGEGVYSAVFLAAMQSAAFFESDLGRLIDIALSYIPEDCAVNKAVNSVLGSHKSGKTWRQARKELFKATPSSFGMMGGLWKGTRDVPASDACPVQAPDPEIPTAEHGYDAPWSVGAVILALLYGGGDFGETVCLAVNCGEDTDCTAGTAGAILGIIKGEAALPAKWKNACLEKIATWTLRIDQNLCLPKTLRELTYRIVRRTPEFLRNNCDLLPGFDGGKEPTREKEQTFYEIKPIGDLRYKQKAFSPLVQEDAKELISEQGRVVRKHFMLYTVLVRFDDSLVKIQEGMEKKLEFAFANMLFTPQYLTVRILDIPEGWEVSGGREFCVGLEHLHGGTNRNSYCLNITPGKLSQGSYTVVLEISSAGRMTKNYLPVTFINGSC